MVDLGRSALGAAPRRCTALQLRLLLAVLLLAGLMGACADPDHVTVKPLAPLCTRDGYQVGEDCQGGAVFDVNYLGSGAVLILHPMMFGPTMYKDTADASLPSPYDQNDGRNDVGIFDINHLASLACQGLVSNGFDDWYLPAVNELAAMLPGYSASLLPIGPASEFWSANEVTTDPTSAYSVDLSGGPGGISNRKFSVLGVRCIRRA